MRSYSELITIPGFLDRFRYLKLKGSVGKETFGCHRYLNQVLYNSDEWRRFRREVLIRDLGCDLAHSEKHIPSSVRPIVHHIEPLTIDDVLNRSSKIFDLENVITTTFDTHQAIHYGDEKLLCYNEFVLRYPNDTCPWKSNRSNNGRVIREHLDF